MEILIYMNTIDVLELLKESKGNLRVFYEEIDGSLKLFNEIVEYLIAIDLNINNLLEAIYIGDIAIVEYETEFKLANGKFLEY